MDQTQVARQVLDDAYPPESRDAITHFLIANGSVYEALRDLLTFAESLQAGQSQPQFVSREVSLVGGSEQFEVLSDLVNEAEEVLVLQGVDRHGIESLPKSVTVAARGTAQANIRVEIEQKRSSPVNVTAAA